MAHSSKYGNVTVQDDSLMNPLNGTDEPVFVLRARDACALGTLESYIEEAETRGSAPEFIEGLQEPYEKFAAWRDAHRDEIKLPD